MAAIVPKDAVIPSGFKSGTPCIPGLNAVMTTPMRNLPLTDAAAVIPVLFIWNR
jgi:hypothetical protein